MATDEVQQVKDRINIVEVVGQYVQLRRAGRNFSGRCPFHNERTPSFMVSPERGTYMCFGCGEKGDVFSFLQKIEGVDFVTALKQLAQKAGVTLVPRTRDPRAAEKKEQEKEREERLREVVEAAVGFYETELVKRSDVVEYLKARGVSQESIKAWRLGYAPASWDALSKHLLALSFGNPDIVDAGFGVRSEKRAGDVFDRFRGRIMFPIFDASGAPIAVSGRFYEKIPGQKDKDDGSEPAKYINSPETDLFKKSNVLYGFDRARRHVHELKCFMLVEGQFDVVMSHQSGLPITVAISGTALTDEHLRLLGKLSKNLILALDADEAGIRSGLKSVQMALKQDFEVRIPVFPDGKDPADIAKENPELLKASVRTSKLAVDFFLDYFSKKIKDRYSYEKVIKDRIIPILASIQSERKRSYFIDRVVQYVAVHDGHRPNAIIREEIDAFLKTNKQTGSSDIQVPGAESVVATLSHLPPMEKKAGMLLFSAPQKEAELRALFGDSLEELRQRLEPRAEELRHHFDREVHEETTPERVADDMLESLKIMSRRAKMKLV